MSEEVARQVTCRRLETIITGRRGDGSNWGLSHHEVLFEERLTLTALRNGAELLARCDDVVESHRENFDEVKKVVEEGFLRVYGRKRESSTGFGGGFRFCKLGEPLFEEDGSIAGAVRFTDLAAHLFFAETGSDKATPLL